MGAGPVWRGRYRMIQNMKKAAPVLQHQDGQVETGPVSQTAPHLHQQFTTAPPQGQAVKIADFLSPGQQNAVPLKYLKDLLRLDERTVRLLIRSERLAGVPICENSRSGYYMPSSTDERDTCAKRLRHRAAQSLRWPMQSRRRIFQAVIHNGKARRPVSF